MSCANPCAPAQVHPTDYFFVKGGACIPDCFPVGVDCKIKSRGDAVPYPHRIAGEFDRGAFTLGATLNPLQMDRQRKVFAAKPAAAGDFVSLIMVPQIHTIEDVFVQIATTQSGNAPFFCGKPNNQAGLNVSLEIRLYDSCGNQTGTVAAPAALTNLDAAVDGAFRAPLLPAQGGQFLPPGTWAEIGLLINALPTTAGVTMDKISGLFGVVAHVKDYQFPLHL